MRLLEKRSTELWFWYFAVSKLILVFSAVETLGFFEALQKSFFSRPGIFRSFYGSILLGRKFFVDILCKYSFSVSWFC